MVSFQETPYNSKAAHSTTPPPPQHESKPTRPQNFTFATIVRYCSYAVCVLLLAVLIFEYFQQESSKNQPVKTAWFLVTLCLVTCAIAPRSIRILNFALLALYQSRHASGFSVISYVILTFILLDYQITTPISIFEFKSRSGLIVILMFAALTVNLLASTLGQSSPGMDITLIGITFCCFSYLENPPHCAAIPCKTYLENR
mgnify:CR=1 FL=1